MKYWGRQENKTPACFPLQLKFIKVSTTILLYEEIGIQSYTKAADLLSLFLHIFNFVSSYSRRTLCLSVPVTRAPDHVQQYFRKQRCLTQK